jgi:hypothetical protein
MTTDVRNIIGLDFDQLQGEPREHLTRALLRDPDVLVIHLQSIGEAELQVVQMAFESGHDVMLVQSTDKALPGTDWLTNLGM